MNETGSLIWKVNVTTYLSSYGRKLIHHNGNFYVTGGARAHGSSYMDIFMAKFGLDGTMLWNDTWGNYESDHGNDLLIYNDHLYILADWEIQGENNILILSYDFEGNISREVVWLGEDGSETAIDFLEISGEMYICGRCDQYGYSTDDVLIMKFLAHGLPSLPLSVYTTLHPGYVTLHWNTPQSDGGSALTGYNIYRGMSIDNINLVENITVKNSFNDYSVNAGRIYYYRIAAVNANGIGDYSIAINITTIPFSYLSLTLIDMNGTPLYNAYITIKNDTGHPKWSGSINETGEFFFHFLPGNYTVQVVHNGTYYKQINITVLNNTVTKLGQISVEPIDIGSNETTPSNPDSIIDRLFGDENSSNLYILLSAIGAGIAILLAFIVLKLKKTSKPTTNIDGADVILDEIGTSEHSTEPEDSPPASDP